MDALEKWPIRVHLPGAPMIDAQRLESITAEAGRIAHALWPGAGHDLDSWEKEPGAPVCEADIAVDTFLKRELGQLLPSAGWLSEETGDDHARLDRSLIWLVDPIDGTRDFIRGRTGWAVSVALVSAGRPLLGILSAPARDETWMAVAGKGAWRNGEPLRASTRKQLAGARVPTDSLPRIDRDLTMVDNTVRNLCHLFAKGIGGEPAVWSLHAQQLVAAGHELGAIAFINLNMRNGMAEDRPARLGTGSQRQGIRR